MSLNIRFLCWFVLLAFGNVVNAQSIHRCFQKIRKNEAELSAFISQMPKGADLHNHYTGAVYAETYLEWLMKLDYYIDAETFKILNPEDISGTPETNFLKFSDLRKSLGGSGFETFKNKLFRFWSTKEYEQVHSDAREEHFFNTFGNFGEASGLNYAEGLQELKVRAIAENVSYIELMFKNISCQKPETQVAIFSNADTIWHYNEQLIALGQSRFIPSLETVLEYLYNEVFNKLPVSQTALKANSFIDSLHNNYIGDNDDFTMRYLVFVPRINDPLITFINLLTAFETVKECTSGNLIGINFLAPEDNSVAMRDYWLHMQFFRFCRSKYENIPFSLHAGELATGYVKPEDLTWHINEAVRTAGAHRIGHGVDIAFEKNNYDLLEYMKDRQVAIEINLLSNEFILGVKDDNHPVLLYKKFEVPIVISTDDPGILRTSLTEQFVLLAQRYPDIKYHHLKQYVYNSIDYSFINDPNLKEHLLQDLDSRFSHFEKYIREHY